MDIKTKIKNIIDYGGLGKNEFISVSPNIVKTNRDMTMLFSAITLLMTGILCIISLASNSFTPMKTMYLTGVIASAVIFMLAWLGKYKFQLIDIAIYAAGNFFMAYGCIISIFLRPEQPATTFIVIMILLPFIFTIRPKYMIIETLVWSIALITGAILKKPTDIYRMDIINVVTFGIFTAISGTAIICTRINSFVLSRKLSLMSTTDKLTGLNNRNCYEWKLDSYPDLIKKSLGCIYIDVNGLHELNNTKGHAAGDQMLITIADIIKDTFGEYDAYRIGGDEFVVFTIDTDSDEINEKISNLKSSVENRSYHVAVGYDKQKQEELTDIHTLIKNAEKRMYTAKDNYYKENGIEHR